VHEEKTTDTEDVVASAAINHASTASTDVDDAPTRAKMIIVVIRPSIRRLAMTTAVEVTPVSLRLPRQEGAEASVLQEEFQWFCIAIPPSLYAEMLG
jgi:hypothetical protein